MNNDNNSKEKTHESEITKNNDEKNNESKIIKNEEENNETKIKKYNLENTKKRKILYDLEVQMKKIKKEINVNEEKIQKICVHEWETIIIYGDPTSYECLKCGLWRRR